MNAPLLHRFLLAALGTALVPILRAQDPPALPPAFESYVAHIAAAEGAMRHGATAAVRRWLDAVPEGERAFEWRWLDAAADQSRRALPLQVGKITCIAASPDGARIATGGTDGVVRVWDSTTFAPQLTITGHESTVHCLSWDPLGGRLVSSSGDRTARVWDAATGAAIAVFGNHTYPVSTVRFSPDGARLASTSYQRPKGGEIRIWDPVDGRELQMLQSGYAPMTCVHWNAAGTKVVGASWDQHLHVFDLADPVNPIITRLGPEPEYRAAQASALSPDGTLVAVGCKDDEVHLLEAWTGKPVHDLKGHSKWVESVAFSPDGRLLASGSADASVILWDVATGEQLVQLRGHRAVVRGLCFLGGGRTLLSASYDGTVRVWDVATVLHSGLRLEFQETAYYGSESPDGTTLAVGFADGDLRLYGTTDGRELRQLPGHGGWINWLQWSTDGRRLMSAGHNKVVIWDVADGAQLHVLTESKGIDCAAWSPDGSAVAAVSRDNKVRLWDLPKGGLRWEVPMPATQFRIAFSPDGAALAVVGAAGAALHDPATGAVRVKFEGHQGRVRAAEFAPDGTRLATAGDDGTVRLWRTADGAPDGIIAGHDNGCLCLAFSPDGTRLATGGHDDRLVLWDVAYRAAVLTLDAKDMYCLSWSGGGRLWVMPLAKNGWCLDAVPLRRRHGGAAANSAGESGR